METLRGTIQEIVFHSEDTGFVVARLSPAGPDGELVTVVGRLAAIAVGEQIEATGAWVEHPSYGRQFRADSIVPELPTTLDGMARYLGTGVGEVTARRIVDHFGERTFAVLTETPDDLRQVPGVGPVRLARLRDFWERNQGTRNLAAFMSSVGIGPALAARIEKQFGDDAGRIVQDEPYRLAREVSGIGFRTADRIALAAGVAADSPERIESAVEFALEQRASRGDVFVPLSELDQAVGEVLDASEEQVAEALARLADARRAIVDDDRVYLHPLMQSEVRSANRLRLLAQCPPIPRNDEAIRSALATVESELGVELAERQREAVLAAVAHSAFVLTGGPGTGKTTTVRGIVCLLESLGLRVALCAPTGRASKRLSELTGSEAVTIHRMLGYSPIDGRFGVSAANPLDVDAVIVDEVSMVDIVLFDALLQGIPTGAHLVLVGDGEQLPAVGPGNVLRDVIASGEVPVIELTELFRQSEGSLIVTNAHRIRRGDPPQSGGGPDRDFFCLEVDDPAEAQRTMVRLCSERLPAHYGFDPIQDIQVLVPMRRGALGTNELNAALQSALNPDGALLRLGSRDFRVGDRVMQTVNNYTKDVYNGDTGQVVGAWPSDGAVAVRYADVTVSYTGEDIHELALAYAVTVHKSQGSEYPAVVLGLHTQHYVMLRRNLLYTAITRARRLVVIVGNRMAVDLAVRTSDEAGRRSHLVTRLSEPAQLPSRLRRSLHG
ncbi:ATP-dependent RecD-like DNA helicase [Candidatus Poribacteria bacterium]|nr:ATP-dependent RecD-like DNA helicase [Candidatus Poribacteria bacterium]